MFSFIQSKQFSKSFKFVFLLISLHIQVRGQFIDVQLFNNGLQCDGIVEVELQVKTAVISQELIEMGSSSILLNYDPASLEFIDYTPIEFDKTTSERAKTAKWMPQRFTVNNSEGLFSLTLIKQNGGEENYELNQQEWITIGKMRCQFKSDVIESSTLITTNLDYTTFTNLGGNEVGLSNNPILEIDRPNIEENPNFELSSIHSWCGNRNGSITISFNKKSTVGNVSFSLNDGKTFQPPVAINEGQVTYDGLRAGTYKVIAQWAEGSCLIPIETISIEKIGPNAPKAKIKTIASTCGSSDGGIQLTFEEVEDFDGIEFSLDGGATFLPTVALEDSTVTFDGLPAGAYEVWARWPSEECPVMLKNVTVKNNYGAPPVVEVLSQDAICSYTNGQLTFQFQPTEGRTQIEFSLDDGLTYQKKVKLEKGTITYDGLSPGAYSVWARWGNDQCPVHLGVFDINNQFGQGPIVALNKTDASCGNSNGTISLDFSDVSGRTHIQLSLDGGQSYGAPIPMSEKVIYEGLASGDYSIWARWDNLDCPTDLGVVTIENKFGDSPIVAINNANATCGLNNGAITFSFSPTVGRTKIEFSLDGGVTYKKSVLLDNGEVTYRDLPVGAYDIWTRWGNDECPISLGTTQISHEGVLAPVVGLEKVHASCGNDNGQLVMQFGPQSEQSTILLSIDDGITYTEPVSLEEGLFIFDQLPVGEYLVWAKWEDGSCPVFIGKQKIKNLHGAAPFVTFEKTTVTCGQTDGSFTFYFEPTSDRSKIEFSLDGGVTYKKPVKLVNESVIYGDLPVGDYDIWVRWGNNECPINLGAVKLESEDCIASIQSNDEGPVLQNTSTNSPKMVEATPIKKLSQDKIPNEQALIVSQNYPNPFMGSTEINFQLPNAGQVYFSVYRMNGQIVKESSNYYEKGSHTLYFQSENLHAGIYYYRISSGDQQITKKMMIIGQ